jgi:DNA polymerase elongation subunit (family B)
MCHVWDDNEGHTKIPLSVVKYAYKKRAGGKYRSIYGDELERITNYSYNDPTLFETDVPPDTRLLIEGYYDTDEISTGHNVFVIDIEVDSEGGFPDMDTADKAIISISYYDKTADKYAVYIIDKENKIKEGVRNDIEYRIFDCEESLLSAFVNIWESISPTIVTGWNSMGFDMPYLYLRLRRILGKAEAARLSPIGICYMNDYYKELICAGVCVDFDYMNLYKRYSGVRKASYALGNIGKEEVGIEKVEYDGNLSMLYKGDIEKFADYNLTDVKIVVELDKKFNYIDQAREICHFCHVPYEYYDVSSRFLEGAVLTYLKRNDLVASNKPLGGREEYEKQKLDDEEGFVGAYVKDPIPGRYNWVYDLDMQSLYPSIIQSFNISPETLIGKIENWDCNAYVKDTLKNVVVGNNTYTIAEFKKLITQSNYGVAANGAIFTLNKKGIIPIIIEKWLEERKETRKEAKKQSDSGNKSRYEVLNRKQVTLKILANSIYGCLGLPIWRWYNKDNAEATTVTGQILIQTAGKIVNQYYTNITGKNEDYVIYCDTDSLFVSVLPVLDLLKPKINKSDENEMIAATTEIAGNVQNYINSMLNVLSLKMFNLKHHKFFIKKEMIAESALWLAKKRYVQWIVDKGGIKCDELAVTGIDTVRTSFPPKFSSVMIDVMKKILKNGTEAEVNEMILTFEENLNTFSLLEGAKSTSVRFVSKDEQKDYCPKGRKPFEIIKGSPAQVRAALCYNDLLKYWKIDRMVEPIYDGQKIRYVYLKPNEYGITQIALKADGTDPKQILELAEKYVDRRKMYEKELKSKFTNNAKEGMYDVLKWSYPSLEMRKAEEFFTF